MVMTEVGLLFLGSLATLATIGMFIEFGDDLTTLVVTFAGAVLWGFFGMSSFDVIVRDTSYASASEPIYPLAYVGIGFAVILGLFAIRDLLKLFQTEAGEADLEEMVR